MKVIRRNIATGDVIECNVRDTPDENPELVTFRFIERFEPGPGEVRHLNIHQEYISFDEFRIDNQNTSETGTYSGEILELGETVYSLTWETNYQGGNGVLSIVRVGNTCFYGAEEGIFGLFSSLSDALQWSELDTFSSVTESIECTEMDSETIEGYV